MNSEPIRVDRMPPTTSRIDGPRDDGGGARHSGRHDGAVEALRERDDPRLTVFGPWVGGRGSRAPA